MMGRYERLLDAGKQGEEGQAAGVEAATGPEKQHGNLPVKQDRLPWQDPRDFDPAMQSDRAAWEMLLRLAWEAEQGENNAADKQVNFFTPTENNPGLFGGLCVLRCMGTGLTPDVKFGYRLVPKIDGRGDDGYASMESYRAEAQELLDPWKDRLHELLGVVGRGMKGMGK